MAAFCTSAPAATAKANDVMAALLAALGVLATAKTHRLLYYVQAWHLAWEGVGMFPNRIEAWASGPIVPEVFAGHAGTYRLEHAPRGASARRLAPGERSTINAVLGFYGGLEGHELASLAQNEDPWLEARQAAHLVGLERGHARITQQSMRRYYGGLAQAS